MRHHGHRVDHVKFHRPSLRAAVELEGRTFDGFHHVDGWVPQRLVTATGPTRCHGERDRPAGIASARPHRPRRARHGVRRVGSGIAQQAAYENPPQLPITTP